MKEMARIRPFAMIAAGLFILNFVWEMAPAGFYSSMKGLPFWPATWLCTRGAAVDVALLALFFAIAAVIARDRAWPLHPTPKATGTFLVLGLLATAAIERWAIATRRWSYSTKMPLVLGIGAAPLLQWTLIPVLSVLAWRFAFSRTSGRG